MAAFFCALFKELNNTVPTVTWQWGNHNNFDNSIYLICTNSQP